LSPAAAAGATATPSASSPAPSAGKIDPADSRTLLLIPGKAIASDTPRRRSTSGILAALNRSDPDHRAAPRRPRFADLRLRIADSFVIACAERRGGRVLTFDRRDFVPVARQGAIILVPS